jgi:hypothetical protein
MSKDSKNYIQAQIRRSAERSAPQTTAKIRSFASKDTIYRMASNDGSQQAKTRECTA